LHCFTPIAEINLSRCKIGLLHFSSTVFQFHSTSVPLCLISEHDVADAEHWGANAEGLLTGYEEVQLFIKLSPWTAHTLSSLLSLLSVHFVFLLISANPAPLIALKGSSMFAQAHTGLSLTAEVPLDLPAQVSTLQHQTKVHEQPIACSPWGTAHVWYWAFSCKMAQTWARMRTGRQKTGK